jgi:antitoxin component HigA of HigAB toxin-antitoxin module
LGPQETKEDDGKGAEKMAKGSKAGDDKGKDEATPAEGKDGSDGGPPPKKAKLDDEPATPTKSSVPGPAASEASLTMVFTSAEEEVVLQYRAAIRRQTTQQLLKANAQKTPFEGDPAAFKSDAEMTKFQVDIMEAATAEEFLNGKETWACAVQAVRTLMKNLGKSAADVQGHIRTLEHVAKTDAENAIKDKQRADLHQIRLEAKEKAEAIRSSKKAAADVTPPLFSLNMSELQIPKFMLLAGDQAEKPHLDTPYVLQGSDRMLLWLADPAVDKSMASYAATYKKAKDCKLSGRGQYPMQTKYGKEETAAYLKEIMPASGDLLDITHVVEGGEAFMESIWLYSFMPGKNSVSIPANCGALLKAHVLGEVPSPGNQTKHNRNRGDDVASSIEHSVTRA